MCSARCQICAHKCSQHMQVKWTWASTINWLLNLAHSPHFQKRSCRKRCCRYVAIACSLGGTLQRSHLYCVTAGQQQGWKGFVRRVLELVGDRFDSEGVARSAGGCSVSFVRRPGVCKLIGFRCWQSLHGWFRAPCAQRVNRHTCAVYTKEIQLRNEIALSGSAATWHREIAARHRATQGQSAIFEV